MIHFSSSWRRVLAVGLALTLGGVSQALGQGATIRGTVTDSATGNPVEGADVTIIGTSFRSFTRSGGQFVLTGIPAGTITIRARMVGFLAVSQRIDVPSAGEIVVIFSLPPQAIRLDDLVVVGYGSLLRRDLSSSVSSISGSSLDETTASPDGGLLGRAPGVHVVQNSGNPGNGITVRIRGSASVLAGNQPLYVVDGIPITSEDVSQLDMGGQSITAVTGIAADDIESIDILKDAAASGIYGSRGSNGVVLISTKRGQVGKSTVTLNTFYGTQSAARRLDLLSSAEYLEYFNEAAENDGYGADYFGVAGVDDQVNTDWQDAVLRRASLSNTELAVTGGNEQIRYRLAGSYFMQNGIVMGSAYDRLAGRANLDFGSPEKLAFSTSLAISGESNKRIENDGSASGIITNAVGNAPLFPVRKDDGQFTGVGSTFPDGLQYPNSVALGTLNDARARTLRVLGNFEARWNLRSGLRFTSRAGVDLLTLRESQYESPLVVGTYAQSAGGIAKTGFANANRYMLENFLEWSGDLAPRNFLQVTGGGTVELNRGELNFVRGEGLTNDRFTEVRNATTIVVGDGTRFENNLISFFGRANYSMGGRFLLGGSLRTDGSSRFGANNKWSLFPAVSAGWVLSEESFLAGNRSVEHLKLRASYGLTGNQAIGDYPWQGTFETANYGSLGGLAPANLANPDLKWETTRQLNFGVDLELFESRVGLTIDYYRKKTTDLLLARPITATSGFTSITDNVGAMENNGFEVGLTTVNLERNSPGGLRWTTTLNFAANRNRITELFNDEPFTAGIRSINRVEVGQPIGAFYALKFTGVDPQTGDAIYEDTDGDGSITADDRQIVGSPHPDFSGGITNNLTYGRFDLSVFFTFSKGAEIFNAARIFSDAGGYYVDNQFSDVLDRWQQPGDVTDQPRASYDGNSDARQVSSRYIENASYLRLQELTLGYDIPVTAAGLLGLSQARFYVTGHNLFIIDKYKGYDPDLNSNGSSANISLASDFYAYPLARTWTFGIQAGW
jgi:TonB-linked SusC/RagA family outer membrane protein